MDILESPSMESIEDVKRYIAHWFQLGKKVYSSKSSTFLLPNSVIESGKYSEEFENCWQYIISSESGDCHLEGTEQTIVQLFGSEWEVIPCSLCEMPIPVRISGKGCMVCPCNDLPGWPNVELPMPRSPIDNSVHLSHIQQRLRGIHRLI